MTECNKPQPVTPVLELSYFIAGKGSNVISPSSTLNGGLLCARLSPLTGQRRSGHDDRGIKRASHPILKTNSVCVCVVCNQQIARFDGNKPRVSNHADPFSRMAERELVHVVVFSPEIGIREGKQRKKRKEKPKKKSWRFSTPVSF